MARSKKHPFFSTTYQLHRISPLFQFPTLDPAKHPFSNERLLNSRKQPPFTTHERALTNLLRGDVLRGVHVTRGDASSDEEVSELGRFKSCKWRLVPTIAALREYIAEKALSEEMDTDDDEEDGMNPTWMKAVRERSDVAGVEVSFEYERGVGGYVAYLIGSLKNYKEGEFTHLPLVLTRLPKQLMVILFEYLAAIFDTLVVPLGVIEGISGIGNRDKDCGDGWMSQMVEMYVEQTKGRVNGDIALAYRVPTERGGEGLKTITVGLLKGDIPEFLNYGTALLPRETEGSKKRKREDDEDGRQPKRKGPFLLAIEKYMESSMSLDASKLVLTKIICGGFTITGTLGSAAVAKGDGDGRKDKVELEAAEPSGRVKISVPRKGQMYDADGSDDGRDTDGRNGEETAAEKFMDELVQLAIRKGGGGNTYREGGVGAKAPNGKKVKQTAGKLLGRQKG